MSRPSVSKNNPGEKLVGRVQIGLEPCHQDLAALKHRFGLRTKPRGQFVANIYGFRGANGHGNSNQSLGAV